MPYFICPRCTWRGTRLSRTEGFSDRPVGCDRCGFGFLFELMDDYYPSPLAGIIVCDVDARIIAFGRGAIELTGFQEQEMIGVELGEALELRLAETPAGAGGEGAERLPHETSLEWGVRVMGKAMTLRASDGTVSKVVGDFFPAYDSDGGLLAVFTPRSI